VEGEEFTAEVVARVLEIDEKKIVQRLSSELDRKHRLVRARVIERLGSQRVSRYRFRNYLFQKYLYDNLDQVERSYLHEDVGNALEELYGDRAIDKVVIAPQLAWHFREAGIAEKAIYYLHKAGEQASHVSAYQEGITHLARGLELLTTLPDSPERALQELALQLALGIAWQGVTGARSSEVKQANTRAYELCQQTGETTQLCQVLGEMVEFEYVGAEYRSARELAEEALSLARQTEDPQLVALGHWYLGFIHFALGEFTTAHDHLEIVISFYEPQAHHHPFVVLRGKDAGLGALAYDACCLWCLGYPEKALKSSQESLALARELGHPFSLADVLAHGGCLLHKMRRDADALKEYAEEFMRLTLPNIRGWRGTGESFLGEALVMMGQVQEGMDQIREGLTTKHSIDTWCYGSGTLGTLAEAEGKTGHPEKGLTILNEALALVEQTDERYLEAELYRLRGELHIMQGDDDQAEDSFEKAIEVARRQSAGSWELRASIGLARLWEKQGRKEEAQKVLGPVYSWFTEGFDTPDLREARALLEEIS
ncbi:MAG: tetratricopeptide repeat protein, partial [Candidatus Promineifilaceae bacterium]